MKIANSVFLVTGGASGLGAATARMVVEGGGKVGDLARRIGQVHDRKVAVGQAGGGLFQGFQRAMDIALDEAGT